LVYKSVLFGLASDTESATINFFKILYFRLIIFRHVITDHCDTWCGWTDRRSSISRQILLDWSKLKDMGM